MIIGIDLGTTNSLAAYYGKDGPVIIPNRLGGHLTPSVVSVEGDQVYVGEVAKERMITHPKDSAAVFKRDMGTDKKYRLGGKEYRPEELSALILRSLKEDAEEFLGEEVLFLFRHILMIRDARLREGQESLQVLRWSVSSANPRRQPLPTGFMICRMMRRSLYLT